MKNGGDKAAVPSLDANIDRLFQLTPPEFVTARNTLAAELKKAGREKDAATVKSIAKPSISAWTVNQLYWRHRQAFDALLETGERFRQAQTRRLAGSGTDIRRLLNERRDTLSEMSRLAAGILQKSSGASPPGVMRRITASLEAISTYGTLSGGPRAGRLVEDVDPPGFDSLAALVPRVGESDRSGSPSRVLSFQKNAPAPPRRKSRSNDAGKRQEEERRAQLAAARAEQQEAARALTRVKANAQKAEAALKKAAKKAKESEKLMVVTEERLQRVASLAHEARQRARRSAVQAETAAQAVDEAERALQRARQTVADLEH